MTEPQLPFDLPLPASHPRADPPTTPPAEQPSPSGPPKLPLPFDNPEPCPPKAVKSFLEETSEFWRNHPGFVPSPPPEGRILSLECINVLAATFETAEWALREIQRAWKDSLKWPESTSGSFYSDWRFYEQSKWAVWEAKKAGVTCRKLLAEVKGIFPTKTPEEIKAFRLARLRPEAQELKTKLAEREKQARELKESLGKLEKSISELENLLPPLATGQPEPSPAPPKEKQTRAGRENPLINNRPLSPEEHAARVAAAKARRAAITPEEREAAERAAMEERQARQAADAAREKVRIEKMSPDFRAQYLAGKAKAKKLMAEERARLDRIKREKEACAEKARAEEGDAGERHREL
jgi:hypothetical protein